MHDLSVVLARLEKLERENRRLKIACGAVVVVLAAVALVGAVMPQGVPAVITAREFRAVDANGTIRASMNPRGIAFLDNSGNIRSLMSETGITYSDGNGELRAALNRNGFLYLDESGITRAQVGDVDLRSGPLPAAVVLYDAEGNLIWIAPR